MTKEELNAHVLRQAENRVARIRATRTNIEIEVSKFKAQHESLGIELGHAERDLDAIKALIEKESKDGT